MLWCAALINFGILNYPCISVINPTWLCYIILLIQGWTKVGLQLFGWEIIQ